MWQPFIQHAVTAAYLCVLCIIAVYGFHRYVLVFLYLRHKHDGYVAAGRFEHLPRVTVQLPMYNEDLVAERIIKAACKIDYPREKLEIQVLDDSTDHSAEIARHACAEMAALGHPVTYLHRTNRAGYKAGGPGRGVEAGERRLRRHLRRRLHPAGRHLLQRRGLLHRSQDRHGSRSAGITSTETPAF